MMWLIFALALPPPCPIANSHDDDRCPRRECPTKTLKPQFAENKPGLLMNDFSEHPSMLRIRQNLPPVSVEHTAKKLNETTNLIDLEQFQDYWQVSHSDLALLTDAPIETVKNWFRANPTRRVSPSYQHLHRLTLAHKYWLPHLNR